MFKKILIANRGEIAVRILRACRELGIQTVAVHSEVDRTSLHVRLADESYPIGAAASRESYLRIDKLMDVANQSGCDALHPGYGFLAENPALPRACADAGITFIGPSAEAMEAMGSKTAGKQLARRAEVPTVPGTSEPIENPEEAQALARGMGYPILLKAIAGAAERACASFRVTPRLPPPGAMLPPKPSTLLAIRGFSSKNILSARGTSKSRYWPMLTGAAFPWGSASVPSSAATRKWWKRLLRLLSHPTFAAKWAKRRCALAAPAAT